MRQSAAIDAIFPPLLLFSVRKRGGAVVSWMEAILAAQKENLFLWIPVFLGCGIGVYFALPSEPPASLTAGGGTLAAVSWLAARPLKERALFLWVLMTAAFLFAAGFMTAQMRTIHVAASMLEKQIKITKVSGTITGLEEMEEGAGQRYILSDVTIEKLTPEKTPAKIRLRVRTGANAELSAGDRVEVLAGLNPPSAPVAPDAFDFQRYAYFQQIGAFGFTYETPRIVAQGLPESSAERIEQFRENIVRRVGARLSDASQSSIAAAMMTGERGAISEADNEDLQASGLAHMLSISGMHIGMIATTIFFAARFMISLFPAVALRLPVKKIAAGAALAGASAYLVLIGVDNVPAVRSLLMTGLVLVAVMLDRMPFSLRTVALAAIVVLFIWPDALWSASFQMSFAAVAALIWFYEVTKGVWARLYGNAGIVRKLVLYLLGLCATSLVASAATAPFVLYHFQRASLYGVLANLLGVPVMGFVVMPAVVVAYLLMPFGWEGPALWAMGKGIAAVMVVARDVAAIPGANMYFPALPLSVFMWLTAGALIAMIWRGKGKWLALLPLAVSIVIAAGVRQPDILISAEGRLFAYAPPGRERVITVSSRVKDRFTAEVWAQRYGLPPDYRPLAWPKEGAGPDGMTCGEGGCRLGVEGKKIAFSFDASTQEEDCAWADIMAAQYPLRGRCAAPVTIDFFDLWREGAHAIWLEDGRIEHVGAERGKRPWTVSNGR